MYALFWPLKTLLSIYKTVIISHWKTKMFHLLMKTYKYKLQIKNEGCITQTATDLSNMKMKNELQLILARKIWTFCFWRNMQFKRNIVSSITLPVQSVSLWNFLLSWMVVSAPILPAHKSVWTIECFDLSDRSLRVLNGLNIAWCFAAVEWRHAVSHFSLSLPYTVHVSLRYGSISVKRFSAGWFSSSITSHERNVEGSHWSQCFDLVMFNLYNV